MTLEDRVAYQIGRAAIQVAKLETQLEEARAENDRLAAELEALKNPPPTE